MILVWNQIQYLGFFFYLFPPKNTGRTKNRPGHCSILVANSNRSCHCNGLLSNRYCHDALAGRSSIVAIHFGRHCHVKFWSVFLCTAEEFEIKMYPFIHILAIYYCAMEYKRLLNNPSQERPKSVTNLAALVDNYLKQSTTWLVMLIVASVLLVIILLVVLVLRKRIVIAIALVKEGSK